MRTAKHTSNGRREESKPPICTALKRHAATESEAKLTAHRATLAPLRQYCLCGLLVCGQLALDSFKCLGRVSVTAYHVIYHLGLPGMCSLCPSLHSQGCQRVRLCCSSVIKSMMLKVCITDDIHIPCPAVQLQNLTVTRVQSTALIVTLNSNRNQNAGSSVY